GGLRADPVDPGRTEFERVLLSHQDDVVVAQRVPLLEVHATAVYVPSPAVGLAPQTPHAPRAARDPDGRIGGGTRGFPRSAVPDPVPIGRRPRACFRR